MSSDPTFEVPEVLESPEEVLSTLEKDGKRRWIYPTPERGPWYWRRLALGWFLIVVFVAAPIVHIGGKPAIFLDIAHREFTFMGQTLYATDTLLLMLFMLAALLSVFLGTALLGRLWCGWGCPQTVYMEFVFRPIERLLEGKESTRKRNDAKDMTFNLAMRKTLKYLIFLVIALGMAHTFVAYFVSWPRLLEWMTGPPAEHFGFFIMMALTTGLILFDFAFFREQMCTIVCPYARFQSVLMDRDSLIVSYDSGRGEPRGRRKKARKKGRQGEARLEIPALGDCIDCGACVRTCPTGIDIREGLQMECIGCTQCVDACDAIMLKVDKPTGLIRYTSETVLDNKPSRVLRPRVIIYSVLLIIISGLFLTAFIGRDAVDLNLSRVPGAPFTKLPDERIANRVRFRIQNRTGGDEVFSISATEPEGTELRIIGNPRIELGDGEVTHIDAWVVTPTTVFTKGSATGMFKIDSEHGGTRMAEFNLLGPSQGAK